MRNGQMMLAVLGLIGAWGCAPADVPSAKDDNLFVTAEPEPQPPSLPVNDWSTLQTTLNRLPCMGNCPAYLVEINGDGRVRYCGVSNVKEVGWRTKTLPVESVRVLAELFAKAGFLGFRDEYGAWRDGDAQSIWLSFDGQSKKVYDSRSDDPETPAVLREIGKAIDDAAGVSDWVGDRSSRWQELDPTYSTCIKQIWKPAGALQ